MQVQDERQQKSARQGFVKPEYDGNSIANIPGAVAKLLGSSSHERPLTNPSMSGFENVENVVLLLLDGLGYDALKSSRETFGVPSFDRIFSNGTQFPITSVFPSTTSSAMCSLHTGLTPQEHGVIGYTMFLGELGVVAQMLRFAPMHGGRSLFDMGLDAQSFLDAKTIHERLNSSGVRSTVYVPWHIVDSGLSRITYRGAFVEPHSSAADMVIRVRKNLETQVANSFHFAYFPSPDSLAHAHGPYSEEYAAELESIFRLVDLQLFQKLDRKVARNTVLIVSGDHGAVRVDSNKIVDVAEHPELLASLKLPPTGDSRASILNVKSGEQDKVRKFFDTKYRGLFEVKDSSKMLSEGFFGIGRTKLEVPDRIGDLVVLPTEYNAIDDSFIDRREYEIVGRHGGLSEEEMGVICAATRLG
jgi:predicted AlkP superfamily pyrophosphatase or phosphodiesterase